MTKKGVDVDLDYFQEEYLNSIIEKIEKLDQFVVSYEKALLNKEKDAQEDALREVKLIVHSLKGSAGSYGFPFITTICHNFEDYIESFDISKYEDSKQISDKFFQFIDLLSEFINVVKSKAIGGIHDLKQRLESLKIGNEPIDGDKPKSNHKVLIIEPNKSINSFYNLLFSELGVQVNFCRDGMEALGRVYEEEFDSLITSHMIGRPGGLALIKMIRASDAKNSSLMTILTTSGDLAEDTSNQGPNYVVKKDQSFQEMIKKIYNNILNKEEKDLESKLETLRSNGELNIAIIDDDEDIHNLVQRVLKKDLGIDIQSFYSGESFFEESDPWKYSVILVDYMMKGMSGPEVLHKLRDEFSEKMPKVIFFTGICDPEKQKNLKEKGASKIIEKPFRPKTLSSTIVELA